MIDVALEHALALSQYYLGVTKAAADLHFSGKLQVDSLGDLVIDVPSPLLRGCLAAVKEPGVELYLGESWKARVVVMTKEELQKVGGPKAVSERGKDFDYRIIESKSSQHLQDGQQYKIWYLSIDSPDLTKLRQAYGLTGDPEGGFKAIFGLRKPRLFQDGSKVTKTVLQPAERSVGLLRQSGSEWVLKKKAKDLIPGGLAAGKADSEFKPKALAEGIKVEKEHTSSKDVAKEITKDHLVEDENYYKKLKKIENPAGVKKADLKDTVQLQPHQQSLVDEIGPDHPVRKLLAWQVGSGKSLGAIAAAEAFGKPYTVIGPAAIRPTFKSEQRKFTNQSLPSEVMSYQKALDSETLTHPESLVVDEAQRIVNPGSRQSQAVQRAADKARQVLLLSGTPIINRPGDFAPIFSILTNKKISPDEFEARYLGQKATPRSWAEFLSGRDRSYEPAIRHRDELKSLLEGKVDWYTPDKPIVETRRSDHEVDMSPDQVKLYQAMFGKIPWRLRLGLDDTTKLSPKELQQLKSFLSGPRQVGLSDLPFSKHSDPLRSFYGSSKLQLAYNKLKERLDSDARTKAIVYSNFPRAGLEPYRAALLHNKIPHTIFDGSLSDAQREEAVRAFNEGKARVALVGPAGAEGISLRGAQLLQQLDPHWNEARMRQSAARGIRFDSHTDLPPELQNIEVQRFISKLPAKQKNWLQSLKILPYREKSQPAADDYLMNLSANKDKSNKLFMELLKEVGQRKQASELVVEKQASLVSLTVPDSCRECHSSISLKVNGLDGSDDVVCSNCGHKTFVLMSDDHRNKLLDKVSEETDKSPSDAQRQAGNYRKGKFTWHDLFIAVENPKDSVRRGTTKDGKAWETKLKDHYGYILKHVSEADGDHMDLFVSSTPDFSNTDVYVIDQFIDGKFDEHKCVILAKDAKDAKDIYHRNYQDGWDGFKNLSTLSLREFKEWLANGDSSKPLFQAVSKQDIAEAKSALKKVEEGLAKVDPTGDDSGGGYGQVILCKRSGKGWIIVGDWFSKEVCNLYERELKKALPQYEWHVEAESFPSGFHKDNLGDWALIKV